jgi:serine/threonine protein kinase
MKKRVIVDQEKKIMQEISHPHVVRCYDSYETDDKMYLFLELLSGGELFDRIVDQGHFTEGQAQEVTFKLIGALKYMHDKNIAHRDLKPENMLMTSKAADAQVKITDFGLSKFTDEYSSLMKTPCGTPGYIAPEVLHMRGYDKKCDVWSLGVIVYILLCGFPPFYADNDAQLFERIKKGQYEFLKPYWDPVSDTAKDLIKQMLIVDPAKRPDCDALLKHKWFEGLGEEKESKLQTLENVSSSNKKLLKLKSSFMAASFVVRDD